MLNLVVPLGFKALKKEKAHYKNLNSNHVSYGNIWNNH